MNQNEQWSEAGFEIDWFSLYLRRAGNEKQQLNQCVHVFLSKNWSGTAVDQEELTDEIEAKICLLRLHDEQQSQCGDEGNANEKMHLAIEIAALYLGKYFPSGKVHICS